MHFEKQTVVTRPMARAEGLLIEHVGDETVVYDLDTKAAHCLDATAAAVFLYADGRNTVDEIADLVAERLGRPTSLGEVQQAVEELEQASLLDLPLLSNGGLSRREMMRRVTYTAGAAALAAPMITSMVAPEAAMAGSSIPTGCTGCGHNHGCLSNHCCQTVAGKQCNESCCVDKDNSCHLTTVNNVNICTVVLSTCPCVCGAPGCTLQTPNCCPPPSQVCCTVS